MPDPVAFARAVCDRERGVGADGVLFLQPSERFDARLRIINADGSDAEMCGNGMRCVGALSRRARRPRHRNGGNDRRADRNARALARAVPHRREMGGPRIGAPHDVAGFRATPVDVGNPHVVIRVDDVRAVDLAVDGPRIEHDPRYPNRTNVHFVSLDGGGLRVRHWERGAGATQACGTGAVAVAAVLIASGDATSPVSLHVPGGVLDVTWQPGRRATLAGDAVLEFERILA